MDDSKKKPVMIAVVVACLVLAGTVTYFTQIRKPPLIPEGQTWVKCNNPECKAEYEMSMKAYLEDSEKNRRQSGKIASVCQKCSKISVFRGMKCEKCGIVFFYGALPNDLADKCPECNYSPTMAKKKGADIAPAGK